MTRDGPIERGGGSASTGFEDVAFLARSANRVALLDVLGRASLDRRALRERLRMSAPTVARILQEFEERGWVERDGHRYRATRVGSAVADGVRGAIETAEAVDRLAPLLATLPPDAPSIDPAPFSDARVTVAEPGAPLAPVRRFLELAGRSETLREANATSIRHFDAGLLADRIESGRRTELIYDRGAIESLRSEYPGTVAALTDCPAASLSIHDSVPFGLTILDERVCLCGYDRESGGVTVLVDTDDSGARRWAEDRYERYRTEATPVTDAGPETETATVSVRPAVVPSESNLRPLD